MTLDPATCARFRLIYPDLATRMKRVFGDIHRTSGLSMRCTDGIRTFAYQESLYAQGRTAPGPIVTHAQAGQSLHNYGLAIDACFRGKDPYLRKHPDGAFLWREYGKFCAAYGLDWAGNWQCNREYPHAQIAYGMNLVELQTLYRAGGLEGVWRKCDQIRGIPPGNEWLGPQTRVRMIEMGQLPG